MKKMLQIVGILIVMSTTYVLNATAQTSQWRPGDGSGMFYTSVQSETDPAKVQSNFTTAMFGTDAQAFRVYRRLDNFSQWEIRAVTEAEMSRQLGAQFDRTNPQRYSIAFEYYKVGGGNNCQDANALWSTYEDSYIFDSSTDHSLHYGNPLYFATYRSLTADAQANKIWMIAVITDSQTGRSVRLRASCGNVLRVRGQVTPPVIPPYQPPVNPPTPYQPPYQPPVTDCKIVAFYANPTEIKKGKTVTLTWNTTCESVTIAPINGGTQTFANVGQIQVTLEESTIFTLTTNTGLTANTSVKVKGSSFWKTAAIVAASAAVVTAGVILLTRGHGKQAPTPVKQAPEQGPSGHYENTWPTTPIPTPTPGDPYTY